MKIPLKSGLNVENALFSESSYELSKKLIIGFLISPDYVL